MHLKISTKFYYGFTLYYYPDKGNTETVQHQSDVAEPGATVSENLSEPKHTTVEDQSPSPTPTLAEQDTQTQESPSSSPNTNTHEEL